MHLISLSLNNFKVLRGNHAYSFPLGISTLTGSNGSGKSTLLNAIAYVFYGPQAIPGGKDNVVTWGEDASSVTVEFSIEGATYRTTRTQKSSGVSHARLEEITDRGWSVRADGLDPTTQSIEKILGLDRVGFLVSVFSSQEELAGLSALTPAVRMKTVLRLLGIDRLSASVDALRSDARALRKGIDLAKINAKEPDELKSEIESVIDSIDRVTSEISEHEHNLEEAHQEIDSLSKRIGSLIVHQDRYSSYLVATEAVEHRRVAAEADRRAAQDALSGPQTPVPGPEPAKPDREAIAGLQRELGQLDAEIRSIEDGIGNSVCPFCNRPYENVDQHNLEQKLRIATESMQSVMRSLREEQDIEVAYSNWERLNDRWTQYNSSQAKARERLRDAEVVLSSIDSEYEAIEQIENRSDALQVARDERAMAEARAIVAEGASRALRDRLSDLTGRRQRLSDALRGVEAAQERMRTERRVLTATELAADEMNALKEDMIGRIIPSLNARSSQLVSEMTDGRYTEVTLTPDYEIQYRNNLGQLKGFDNLSGGEKDIFALALRLALADVQADRLGVLMLDEIFESLDVSRQEMAWVALDNLTRRYNQILVVTHVSDFRDRAPNSIQI